MMDCPPSPTGSLPGLLAVRWRIFTAKTPAPATHAMRWVGSTGSVLCEEPRFTKQSHALINSTVLSLFRHLDGVFAKLSVTLARHN